MNLKTFAKLYGVRLNNIADYCGVSPQAVSLWAKGDLPSPENFLKLAAFFNLSPSDIKYKKPLYFPEKILYNKKIKTIQLENFELESLEFDYAFFGDDDI